MRFKRFSAINFLASITLLSMIALAPMAKANLVNVAPTKVGVNYGIMSLTSTNDEQLAILNLLKSHGLQSLRVQVNLADDTDATIVSEFQNLLTNAKTVGIEIKPLIAVPFSWGNNRTDNGKYPLGDQAALYSQGYNRTYAFVKIFGKQVRDWELQNELNLLPRDANGSPLYGKGWTAGEFAQFSIMQDWASVLKGMSDAVTRLNSEQALKLRRVVGTTSTMFGFIDFMISKGVVVDVIGYHYYELLGTDPNNFWGGVNANFNLFEKFASYKKSVFVNEINCAEIYGGTFSNTATSTSMQTCNTNLANMLKLFLQQKIVNIEQLQIYELVDEPSKAAPENHFGLLFSDKTPKPTFATVTSAAVSNASQYPDLIVTLISMTPLQPKPGDKVQFTATLKNQGTMSTPAGITHGIGFSVDGKVVTWSSNFTTPLAAGQSVTLTANNGVAGAYWAATLGSHVVTANVDDVNRLWEKNESNNLLSKSFAVANPLGDLVVTSFTMRPAKPKPGDQVFFTATIKNQGTAATPALTHGVGFAVDGKTVTWATQQKASLAIGQSVQVKSNGGVVSASWLATQGTHSLTAFVDDVNRIPELNEANNKLTLGLTVPAK